MEKILISFLKLNIDINPILPIQANKNDLINILNQGKIYNYIHNLYILLIENNIQVSHINDLYKLSQNIENILLSNSLYNLDNANNIFNFSNNDRINNLKYTTNQNIISIIIRNGIRILINSYNIFYISTIKDYCFYLHKINKSVPNFKKFIFNINYNFPFCYKIKKEYILYDFSSLYNEEWYDKKYIIPKIFKVFIKNNEIEYISFINKKNIYIKKWCKNMSFIENEYYLNQYYRCIILQQTYKLHAPLHLYQETLSSFINLLTKSSNIYNLLQFLTGNVVQNDTINFNAAFVYPGNNINNNFGIINNSILKKSYNNNFIKSILEYKKNKNKNKNKNKCIKYFHIYYNIFLRYLETNKEYYQDINSALFSEQINKLFDIKLNIYQHIAMLITFSILHSYIHNSFYYTSQIIPRNIVYKENNFSTTDFIFQSGHYNTDLYIHTRFPGLLKYINKSFYNSKSLIEDISNIEFHDDILYKLLHHSKIGLIIQE